MPILTPTQTQFYIKDLEPNVIRKVENRTTEASDIDRWIRDTILEFAGNVEYRESFDQLEVIGPQFNLTQGVQEYSFNNVIPVGDYNIQTLDVLLWVDYPTNSVRRKLAQTDFRDADKFQQTQSVPSEFYRFGDNIGFNPVPNQPYKVQARIMRRHPINDLSTRDTLILLPREWFEVIEWAAAMRGFMELLEYEKAANIRSLIHGDPKHPELAGLIQGVKIRRRQEAWMQEQPLRPIIRGYGWGRS